MPFIKVAAPYYLSIIGKGKFNLVLSTEILPEYQEVLQQKYSVPTANSLVALLYRIMRIGRDN
ncbi:MAG: hypothetical protein ABI366_08010 [Ginsengibacter sp.]